MSLVVLSLSTNGQTKRSETTHPFKKDENLTYVMSYGWFEIGEASLTIDKEWWYLEEKPHYYLNCQLYSTGFVGFFSKIDVCMESWVNPKTLRPIRSSRDLAIGSKIDVRTDRFTYLDSVRIHTYVEDVDSRRYHAFDHSAVPIFDALSTYLFLRNQDQNQVKRQGTIPVRTFFSNDLYSFSMSYIHHEVYECDDRSIQVIKYELNFPESTTFPEGKRAYVLVTADANRLPVKFLIEMKYGDFSFELKPSSR